MELKITTEEALDMFASLNGLAALSEEKEYKKLNVSSNLFLRIALMIRKLKPIVEVFEEQSAKLKKDVIVPVHKKSTEDLDKDGNPMVLFNGYVFTEGRDEYFEKIKEMKKVEVVIENPIMFKSSEFKGMLSANDYMALIDKILEVDETETDKKKKSSK